MKTKAALLFEKQEYETIISKDGLLPTTPNKNSTMVICGDGSYLVRKNEIGLFSRKISSGVMPAIPDGPGEGSFTLALPKIPREILETQVRFYRQVMLKHNNAESYTMILWDRTEQKYIVVCPNQKISAGSVQYDLNSEWSPERYLPVVSCHSHNSMGAFFSGIDDADEKGDMCYMVMGNLHKPVPTFRIRASVAGAQIKFLELNELFTMDEKQWTEETSEWLAGSGYPAEWMEKLNVAGNYVNVYSYQGGGTRSPFRFGSYGETGSYTEKSWPTDKAEQTSFFEWADKISTASTYEAEVSTLRSATKDLHKNFGKWPATEALVDFFENLMASGFGEELFNAIQEIFDEYEQEPLVEFSSEVDLSRDDFVLGDEINGNDSESFEKINDFIKNMQK